MMINNIPVFTEDADKKIVSEPELPYNFLLEGDNLHSLKLLEKTHKGKIDVIYIDPPYNTGNKDFIYNDEYIDEDDGFNHSKWLSFMDERLEIARNLLCEEGIIFISIDDHEYAQLKILCDEIFGENNFISNIVIETGGGIFGVKAKHVTNTFVKVKDYILVYAKERKNIKNKQPLYDSAEYMYDSHYNTVVEDEKEMTLSDYLQTNEYTNKIFARYNFKVTVDNINRLLSASDEFKEYFITKIAKILYQPRRYTLKLTEQQTQEINSVGKIFIDGVLIKKSDNGIINFYKPFIDTLHYADDFGNKYTRTIMRGDLWKGFNKDAGNLKNEGGVDFPNGKKPIRLLKQILKWYNKDSAIVLDFFAGSGSMGHAVLDLNKIDGGNRKFILCTNNENNICEDVTYQRLKTVITGIKKDGSKYSDGIPANLKYYKTDFVSKISKDDDYFIEDKLTQHIKEMIELENAVEIDNDKYILLLTDEEADTFEQEMKDKNVKKVYIDSTIMLSGKAQSYLDSKQVEVIPIPDYYFYKDINAG